MTERTIWQRHTETLLTCFECRNRPTTTPTETLCTNEPLQPAAYVPNTIKGVLFKLYGHFFAD